MSLDALRKATYDELINIPDIGDKVSNSIVEFFHQDNIIVNIEELLKLGVRPYFKESKIEEKYI
jgi:DNA ligase (NAD+)